METLRHRLYRRYISLATLIDFFFRSLVHWPPKTWVVFWFSKHGLPHRAPSAHDIAVRTDTFLNKIIDSHMAFTCIALRQYELNGFAIRAGDTVVDIGGHIGSFALHAEAQGALVVSCEPSPENFRMLCENTTRNNARAVTALPVCVAGKNGARALFLDKSNAARNGLYGRGAERVSVEAVTLDELFVRQQITHCDLLKVDCEGAEYEIIETAALDTLARIEKIAMEYHLPPYFGLDAHKHQIAALTEKLSRAGFAVEIVPENALRGLIFARNTRAPHTPAKDTSQKKNAAHLSTAARASRRRFSTRPELRESRTPADAPKKVSPRRSSSAQSANAKKSRSRRPPKSI